MQQRLICPSCSSEAVQKLSVTYSNGIQLIDTTTSGMGIGMGAGGVGIGVGSGRSTGTSQSVLSKMAAPPDKVKYGYGLVIGLIGWIVLKIISNEGQLLFEIGIIALIAVIAYMIFKGWQYNTTKWPIEYAKWQKKFMCLTCGHIFTPKD